MEKKKTEIEELVDSANDVKAAVKKKLKQRKTKKKKEEPKAKDFQNDLDAFLAASGVQVQTLGEHDQVPYWIHSGSYALNWIISGDFFKGIPGTKVIMLSGEEAKGKSLISDVWLGENVRINGQSYKVDVEDAVGSDFTAKVVGDEEIAAKIRIITPSTLSAVKKAKGDIKKLKPTELVITIEKLTSFINKLIDWQLSKGEDKLSSIVIAIDSVSNLTSDKEIEDIAADKDKRDMTPQQKMRAFFRAVNQKLKDAHITIVGIAHLTANIGVMFGPKKTVSAKGTGFKYASSLIINCVSSKEIIDSNTDTAIGIKMKLTTTKNRMAYKGKTSFLYMYFNYGIDPYGGIAELLVQYNLAKPSAKPGKDGGFKSTTLFTYEALDGTELKWKSHELFEKLEAMPEEEKLALLQEWNDRINEEYQDALEIRGTEEDEILEEDDPTTEEEEYEAAMSEYADA